MTIYVSGSTVRRPSHPVLRFFAAFPVAFFCGALVTDLAYWRTADMMWANFSAWQLALGVAAGGLAALIGLVVWVKRRRDPEARPGWPVALGSLLVLGLAMLNNFVHSRDAWLSVVPEGLALSAATVVLILLTAFGSASLRPRDPTPAYSGVRS